MLSNVTHRCTGSGNSILPVPNHSGDRFAKGNFSSPVYKYTVFRSEKRWHSLWTMCLWSVNQLCPKIPDHKKAATSTPSSDSHLDPEVFARTVRCLPPPISHPNEINWPYHRHNHNHQHDSFYHHSLECTKWGQEGCPWKDFAKCSSDALVLGQ